LVLEPKVKCARDVDLERQLAEAKGLPTDSEVCHSCGSAVAVVWAAKDEDWRKVVGGPGGILCPKCFDSRAEKRGLVFAYIAVPLADGWRTDWYEAQGKLDAVQDWYAELMDWGPALLPGLARILKGE
jgi:hypothetical protein